MRCRSPPRKILNSNSRSPPRIAPARQRWPLLRPHGRHFLRAVPDALSATSERPTEETELEHGLSAHLPPGKVLELRLTENRYTIISVERGRECYRVRVHRMFAGVEPRLVRALARYVVHNDPRASRLLSEFIERHQDQIRRIAAARPACRAADARAGPRPQGSL